jgi:aconitate hydratase
VLTITEMLRKAKVVGKFVEFFGEGRGSLALPDRATIANMAPEYGATMGFFPVDEKTVDYFAAPAAPPPKSRRLRGLLQGAGPVRHAQRRARSTTARSLELDLASVAPSLAGPKRPQDRIELGSVKSTFAELFSKSRPGAENGFAKKAEDLGKRFTDERRRRDRLGRRADRRDHLVHQHLQPGRAARRRLLAKKAVERGLTVKPHIKTSLAPGSRVVTEYLTKAGLLPYLEKLGFARGGLRLHDLHRQRRRPLAPDRRGDRRRTTSSARPCSRATATFEARIHPNLKANFLASPPLVVAYALAGTVLKDLMTEPLGKGKDGKDVWIGDIWPTSTRSHALMPVYAMDPKTFRRLYGDLKANPLWKKIGERPRGRSTLAASTYIAEPPFFDDFGMQPGQGASTCGARALGIFGDSVTTDHISPGGLDQADLARRQVPDGERRAKSPTSTATARAAATTKS